MRKALAMGFLLVLSSFSASGAGVNATISQSCGQDYEPLISMADRDEAYNNPGPPEMYSDKVCVKGIDNAVIANDCFKKGATGFYLYSETTESHFSIFESYNKHVCTGRMQVKVVNSRSCPEGEEALFSVSSDHNAHVAEPGFFDWTACGFLAPPENVTLEFEANLSSSDTVYFDDVEVEGENTYYPPAENPYLVSESGEFLTGLVVREFKRAERRIEGENVLSIRRNSDNAEYLVPFTSASHEDVENRQEQYRERELLTQLQPSMGFFTPETPTVKVAMDPEELLESELELSPGSYELNITKIGDNRIRITAE